MRFPRFGDGLALKDKRNEDGDEPSKGEKAEYADGTAAPLDVPKNAVVGNEDGGLDNGDQCTVDQLRPVVDLNSCVRIVVLRLLRPEEFVTQKNHLSSASVSLVMALPCPPLIATATSD
jgi:hypothetical protein